MKEQKKMSAKERRDLIVTTLKETDIPITGNQFAEKTNVSRQVIVQDVSILKAKKEPIIATSRGYMYLSEQEHNTKESLIIAVSHTPKQTKEELYAIVDNGVTVKNVTVEHAVYGEITASIMVSSRIEVDQFIQKVNDTKAPYLSSLTEGVHLHLLEADSMDKINAACEKLAKAKILL